MPSLGDDDDPVTAEYDVYITASSPQSQTYLLQYPNRNRLQPYNARSNAKPLELRIKPSSGFLEIDVPMNVYANFDKTKGIKWGEAMLKTSHNGGSSNFGLAAGFARPRETGAAARRARARGGEEEDEEGPDEEIDRHLENFEDANSKGHVMNKQTLGGQILKEESGKPIYMLGAFRGKELHLTKVTGLVQMRPQFHHLDASSHVESAARRREREAAEPPRDTQPRAVQMSVKQNDTDGPTGITTKDYLQAAQQEPWTKLRYHDEDTDEAYGIYHDKLFIHDTEGASQLKSSMTNEEYLDAISAPRHDPSGRSKKKPLTKKQMQVIEESEGSEDDPEEVPPPQDPATSGEQNDAEMADGSDGAQATPGAER
ncbi:hypothetical protein W97_00291 [Coniosporium apollinis CBS 100218]|uniref:Uncharacterized protein n=1 Tax=Coniosporium apollinis (strain CBS 100218) TaxID=1168221 RepID=R7YGS1_CONA1|nr:uncharacterized protein W97_00291 [Coniosporium apollinis CBS 100218]EON61080.1 hypothetical protein W97_00291 [Coniosporium apollinis CBS 100218]